MDVYIPLHLHNLTPCLKDAKPGQLVELIQQPNVVYIKVANISYVTGPASGQQSNESRRYNALGQTRLFDPSTGMIHLLPVDEPCRIHKHAAVFVDANSSNNIIYPPKD